MLSLKIKNHHPSNGRAGIKVSEEIYVSLLKKRGGLDTPPHSKSDLERIRTFIVRTGILYSIH